MSKNAYANKLMAMKGAVSQAQRQVIIHRCIETVYYSSAIALNEEFSFGPDRIAQFRAKMEKIVNNENGVTLELLGSSLCLPLRVFA